MTCARHASNHALSTAYQASEACAAEVLSCVSRPRQRRQLVSMAHFAQLLQSGRAGRNAGKSGFPESRKTAE